MSITSGTKAMLEDSQFQTLDAIMKKFEMVESRFASIRKYVKTIQQQPISTSSQQQKALQIDASGFPYAGTWLTIDLFPFPEIVKKIVKWHILVIMISNSNQSFFVFREKQPVFLLHFSLHFYAGKTCDIYGIKNISNSNKNFYSWYQNNVFSIKMEK